jgi:hypothetical protein
MRNEVRVWFSAETREIAIDTLPEDGGTADDIMKGYAVVDESSGASEKRE